MRGVQEQSDYSNKQETSQRQRFSLKTIGIHGLLFLLTFFTSAVAGVQWLNKDASELTNLSLGVGYASLILTMLASHEFGHYFAARHHGVETTLPFFIPFPSYFGTLGAVIRLRSIIPSRKVLFDIGAAGPVAGFITSVLILVAGFVTLPTKEYLIMIHPEYAQLQTIPEGGLAFGNTIYYSLLSTLAPADRFLPPMNEIYHYPLLCVGWFGMFVTAMNLIPIGQLDGGHISYAMFGSRYHRIAQVSLIVLLILGFGGLLPLADIPVSFGWSGWLFWAFLLILFSKVLKLNRPPVYDETPLDTKRMAVGWLCWLIFAGSFSITPFAGL